MAERTKLSYHIGGEVLDIRYFENQAYTIEEHLNHLVRSVGHALCRGRPPDMPDTPRRVRDLFVLRGGSI